MAIQSIPLFLQSDGPSATGHPAEDVRRWMQTVHGDSTGVLGANDLKVTVSSGLTVSAAAGRAVVAGTESATQGAYFADARTATLVTLATANAVNPRIDLIVVRVRDSAYSGLVANDGVTIEAVTGTAAASPAAPATPANSIVLARVAVAANATTLVAGNITDYRTFHVRPGGIPTFTDAADRTQRWTTPAEGAMSYLTADDHYYWYDGAAWNAISKTTVSLAAATGGIDGDIWVKVV